MTYSKCFFFIVRVFSIPCLTSFASDTDHRLDLLQFSILFLIFLVLPVDPGINHSLIISMMQFLSTLCLSLLVYCFTICSQVCFWYSVLLRIAFKSCQKNAFSILGKNVSLCPILYSSSTSAFNYAMICSFLVVWFLCTSLFLESHMSQDTFQSFLLTHLSTLLSFVYSLFL